jgi:hypothetical protein
MNKNWRSSLAKWNAGLWTRLEKYLANRHIHRKHIWNEYIWHQCGFCVEFPSLGNSCRNCPLNQDQHCNTIWGRVPGDSVLRTMRTAWEDNNREAFEEARQKFYNTLISYRDRFQED